MKSRLFVLATVLATTAGVSGTAFSSEPVPQSQPATLGDHPAVIVARTSTLPSINPNTFIVAHAARLQLLAASPNEAVANANVEAIAARSTSSAAAGR